MDVLRRARSMMSLGRGVKRYWCRLRQRWSRKRLLHSATHRERNHEARSAQLFI